MHMGNIACLFTNVFYFSLQKDALSGEIVTSSGGFLWEEQVCDQMV